MGACACPLTVVAPQHPILGHGIFQMSGEGSSAQEEHTLGRKDTARAGPNWAQAWGQDGFLQGMGNRRGPKAVCEKPQRSQGHVPGAGSSRGV